MRTSRSSQTLAKAIWKPSKKDSRAWGIGFLTHFVTPLRLFLFIGLILSATNTLKKIMLPGTKAFVVWPATLSKRTWRANFVIKAMRFPILPKSPSGIWAVFPKKDSSPPTFTHLSSYWLASSSLRAQVMHWRAPYFPGFDHLWFNCRHYSYMCVSWVLFILHYCVCISWQ